MKKIIIFLLCAMLGVTSAHAQFRGDNPEILKASVIVYGGYNPLENQPLAGGAVAVNAFFLRAEVEMGWSSLNTYLSPDKKHFWYFSPSFGVSFGYKHEFYAMYGFTTWPYVATTAVTECNSDKFLTDLAHSKLKVGMNWDLGKKLILNTEVGWVIPKKESFGYVHYQNLPIRIGLGYRF